MINYIVDQNKFVLAGPPKWWLSKLWDFDDSLVVIPSRQGFYYRLAQRRMSSPSADVVNSVMWQDSDTQMLVSYGLIPVTTILSTANWSNPYLFEELRNRAPWRLGGADAVADRLDDEDRKAEIDKRVKTDEHLEYLGKDSWKLYNKKIGLRTHMYTPTVKQAPKTEGSKSAAIIISSK